MKKLIAALAVIALGLTIVPGFLVLQGVVEFGVHKKLMLAGTILWFITAPFWLSGAKKVDD